MLAVRWHGRGDVRVEEVPPPASPGPGEVQLRVSWCGICGTDLEEWRSGPVFIPAAAPHPVTGARAPLVLGHEFAGVVVAAGAGVTGPWPGQRVAVDTIVSCGTCYWCRRGEVTRCPALGALGLHGDGGLAELCNAPARICLPVPDTVADDEAALAEPLAVAVRALRRGGLRPGERVAVVGAGTVGLMAVQAAVAFGANGVAVVEPLPERRALAVRLGAGRAVPPGEAGELEADVAVECAGTAGAVGTALQALRSGGRAVLLGIAAQSALIAPMDLIRGEKSLIGSLSHVWDQDFREALQLLGGGAVQAAPLITDRIPLSAAVTGGLALLRDEPEKHLKILAGESG
ncbi:MAG TPA: alcohol dehydrogenase catalytic domain-containing protein [Streptosporangiaceae bacterium]|nr:alcohol dehydrogenase catalytic domain-containing protein [Streptosporangiaceae bacterium]